MKKTLVFLVLGLLLLMPIVATISASEGKADWLEKKSESIRARADHREARQAYNADKTNEDKKQEYIDTGKASLNAALDEAEAWLVWKKTEAEENQYMPDDLESDIKADVAKNLDTIEELREDVEGIDTELELGIVWLKCVGKYIELLTDVARNSGKAWVEIANAHADRIESYEDRLRDAAGDIDDNQEIIDKLDVVKQELASAREHIGHSEGFYNDVQIGSTPLINFHQGNQHLRLARADLLESHINLRQAFRLTLQKA